MNTLASIPAIHSHTIHTLPEYAPKALDQYDLQVWHNRYNCSLHTWLSQAKVKTGKNTVSTCFILYIEYRDYCRCSRYAEFSFSTLHEALEFRTRQAGIVELQGISPKMTQRYPVKAEPQNDEPGC